ncbi:cellulose synthase-like protein e1 [Quercus suber]|uniref:Cellulose synthase-like protein e1 n=1 Tax=Quercus suber TaxID=58331 RepID=A0AAW0IMJ2_QUESU
MEMPRYDGNEGCCYIGTGCFHRRETLSRQKYSKNFKVDWKRLSNRSVEESTSVLEEKCKVLASSSYEKNSQWGKEIYVCVISHAMSRLEIHIFQSKKEGLSRSCSHNTTTVTCTTQKMD